MVEGRTEGHRSIENAATSPSQEHSIANPSSLILPQLIEEITEGKFWALALMNAIGRWSQPRETVDGLELTYLLGGEAFDWLLLAERLLRGVEQESAGLVPAIAVDRLLISGQLPEEVSPAYFREALGFEKYRAHLNFFYGVVVEEALWHAVEQEVQKERGVRGLHQSFGISDMVFEKLYRADFNTLMRRFRRARGERASVKFTLSEWKEFRYSLFRYRLSNNDSARIASDTHKGLTMLEEILGFAPDVRDHDTLHQ